MNKNINAYIGKQIYVRRRTLGLTQAELGKLVGVTFQQIQKYEKALTNISARMLFNIAEAMQVKFDYFFESFNEPQKHLILNEVNKSFDYRAHEDNNGLKHNNLIKLYSSLNNNETKQKFLKFLEALAND